MKKAPLSLLLGLILFVAGVSLANATITFTTSQIKATAKATTCVLPSLTATAGQLLVVTAQFNSSTVTSTISSTNSDTWLQALRATSTAGSVYTFYSANVNSGATVATVSYSASVTSSCQEVEYAGLGTTAAAVLDVTNSSSSAAGSTALRSGTSTTNFANELIVGNGFASSTAAVFTAGTGYTMKATSTIGAHEYQIVSSASGYNTAMTIGTSALWIDALTAFIGVPTTPGTPSFGSVTASTLTASWTSGANSTYYSLARATSSAGTYTQIATTTSLSYGDSGLTGNTSYWYKVNGVNAAGSSTYSATSTQLMLPATPGTPSYSNISTSSVTVSWTAPTGGATYYSLARATSSAGTYTQITTTTSLSYGDSGLVGGASYWYEVRGVNATGNGSYSATSTVTTATPAPNATSVSTTVGGNGGHSGDSITISGTNFGTVATSSAATCNGGVGTGCIQFIVGGTDTVASASITSWTNTSIVFTISPTLASNGGVGSLEVWAANASDTTPLTFYIYPNITAVTALGLNAAREYSGSDTDGLIMLSGDHFGTSGSATILGSSATQYGSVAGPCTVGGYTSTSVCLEVPTSIANNNYSGNVVLTRASDSLTATSSLSILPRITGINPSSQTAGSVMQIVGNHFCQTGTCPTSPNRASGSNNVTLAENSGGPGYWYIRTITVGSNASGTNINFPMLVSSTVSSWASVSNGGHIQNLTTAPNGIQEPADLIFTSDSGCSSPLNFETEGYSSSTGALVDWVNVSSLSAGSLVYICYGNTAVTTDQSRPGATWNSNYQFVYHFPLMPSGNLNASDSTQFGNAATAQNNVTATMAGEVGGGVSYSSGGGGAMENSYTQTNVTTYTEEAWIKTSGTWYEEPIINDRNSYGYPSMTLFLGGYGSCGGACGEGGGDLTVGMDTDNVFYGDYAPAGSLEDGNWHYVVATLNQASGTAITPSSFNLYIDGVQQSLTSLNLAGSVNSPFTASGGTWIGYHTAWSNNFEGAMDEVRVSTAALSPSWIATEYNNENSPSSFYTIGSEQPISSSSTIPDANFVNLTGGGGTCNGSGAAWSDGELCATIPSNAALGVTQTTITSNGVTSNAYSFTVTQPAPSAPGTPSYSNITTSTVTVSWTAGANSTYYSIARATSAGGTYSQITTTTSLSYNDSGLTPAATYWYKVRGVNAGGNGPYSATSSVTMNTAPPNPPSEDSPVSGAQNLGTTPTFLMTGTDTSGYGLEYKVTIYADGGCSSIVQTDDESASQTGWSGQNASSGAEYTSGTQGSFTVQSALSEGVTYYWKASAKDPEGSNTWTDSTTCNSFSTTNGLWVTDSGNWSISSNELTVTPGTGNYAQIHVVGQSLTNAVVEFKMSATGGATGNAAPILRADAGSNRYQLGELDYANQAADLVQTISNSNSTIASSGGTFSASTVYDLRGIASSGGIGAVFAANGSAYGGQVWSSAQQNISGPGYVGIEASGNNTFSFTDFAVYSSTIISLSNLPSGGSWSALDHSGAIAECNTGSTWDTSGYYGYNHQIPVDYDNGGGQIAVWTNNSCSGTPATLYPSSGFATDIFGGDTYLYTPGSSGTAAGPIVTASTTITISATGLISD